MANTPGPWFYDEWGYIWQRHPEKGQQMVGQVRGVGRGASDEEMDSNGRIMAAGLNLLECLEAAHVLCLQTNAYADKPHWRTRIEDAIARAKGEIGADNSG